MKLLLSSPKLKCAVSKLSHWFTDNLVLSIQMSNVIALAMVKAIKMCDWKCREVVQKQDEQALRDADDLRWLVHDL